MTVANELTASPFKEQRRIDLLNDPNFGIILSFLDKFRSILDLPNYPLQLLEDHLINSQESIPSRLIDFHFILLKRISLAKNAQRENFDSILTKFVARFDINDSEYLTTHGYLQSDIHLKLRTLRIILESQFDLNQQFRNALVDKLAQDVKAFPLGRDRFGNFLLDDQCYVRLFREDIDENRTWTNVVKNQDELEKFIKILITDSVVRKRFPDWIIAYEPFVCLPSSNEFEQYYSSISIHEKENEMSSIDEDSPDVPVKRKRGRPKCSLSNKTEPMAINDEKPNLPIKRKRGRPPKQGHIETCNSKNHQSILEENNNDDAVSLDDMSLSIRRSLRSQKVSPTESTPKPSPQLSNTKTKKRKKRSRRNTYSTSSSDEHIDDNISEDEYNSDDYISNPSLNNIDDAFFQLDEDMNDINIEEIHQAKTAQTLTIVTVCHICSKSDRPEVLLLCDNCDDGYHIDCLSLELFSIPDGDWYCPLCEHQKLSICLIEKYQEFLINSNKYQTKQMIRLSKRTLQRKLKLKEYSSDESLTASESEHDDINESISQINDNSNLSLSSSNIEENFSSISQRGRHRRIRFDMKQIFDNDHDDEDGSQRTNINLELPTKMTRLLHRHDRTLIKTSSRRLHHSSMDSNDTIELNEKLDSPLVYVNSDGNSSSCNQIKSVITNSKQTLKIVRRWNDVQRRSRLKAMNMKTMNDTIPSDYADENSNFALSSHSNDSHSNCEIKDDNSTTIIPSLITTIVLPIDNSSSRNIIKKVDASFDRLTRDIQLAVNEASIKTTTKLFNSDQQSINRNQKKIFSPFMTKSPFISKPFNDISKLKDSSSTSSLDTVDKQTMNT